MIEMDEKNLQLLIQDSIKHLYFYLDVKFKEVDDKFQHINERLDAVNQKMNRLQTTLEEIVNQME
jgi:predicted  nucleic acid-binding Zn-ribbon protein